MGSIGLLSRRTTRHSSGLTQQDPIFIDTQLVTSYFETTDHAHYLSHFESRTKGIDTNRHSTVIRSIIILIITLLNIIIIHVLRLLVFVYSCLRYPQEQEREQEQQEKGEG